MEHLEALPPSRQRRRSQSSSRRSATRLQSVSSQISRGRAETLPDRPFSIRNADNPATEPEFQAMETTFFSNDTASTEIYPLSLRDAREVRGVGADGQA